MSMTSSDIKIGLRSAFPAPGWQIFYEVGDDTGFKQRRWADAVAMGIWPSNGHLIHGMEIKVSRGDFLSEMKNPTKSQSIFQYCNRWSLVTPPGLVKQSELPDTWGLMTYDGKCVRTVKKAPALAPVPLTAGFVAAMLRRAGEVDDSLIAAAVAKAQQAAYAREKDVVQRALDQYKLSSRLDNDNATKQLAAYQEVFGKMSIYDISALAPILKLVKAVGIAQTYGGVKNLADRLDETAKTVRHALNEFEPDQFEDLLG